MIWVIGHKGMLGSELASQLSSSKIPWVGSDSDVDITDIEALDAFAQSHDTSANRTGGSVAKKVVPPKITWVINCAAWTNVDGAEDNKEKAASLNETGPRNIARVARKIGAKLIHISTDYVFDGTSSVPYTEEDKRCPLGVYGDTKAKGEIAIEKEMTQYYILRTAWMFGFAGKNFVYTMVNAMNKGQSVQVVNDQRGTPTFTADLASTILKIISVSDDAHHLFGRGSPIPYGIYHFTNAGETTWYDFAKKIYELSRKYKKVTQQCTVNPCTSEEFVTKCKRPSYSVLDKAKIQSALKIKIPSWEDALERFIKSDKFKSL